MNRIAWFSPVNSSSIGRSSIYSEYVVPSLLKRGWDIEVFVDDHQLSVLEGEGTKGGSYTGITTYHYLRAAERDRVRSFDAMVYHLEDCAETRYVQFAVGLCPSWVFVHDSHLLFSDELKSALQEVKVFSVFDSSRDNYIRDQFRSTALEFSEMPIPSSKYIKSTVSSPIGNPPTVKFPLVGQLSAPKAIACFGSSIEENHCLSVLEAFALLAEMRNKSEIQIEFCWIVFSSEEEAKVRRIIAQSWFADRSDLVVRLISDREELEKHLSGTIAAIALDSLSYSSFGLRPFVLLCMSCGLPVILSDCGPAEDLPSSVVLKIPLGVGEATLMARLLERVISDERFSSSIRNSLTEYLENVSYPDAVIADFEATFCRQKQALSDGINDWRNRVRGARNDLVRRSFSVFETIEIELKGHEVRAK